MSLDEMAVYASQFLHDNITIFIVAFIMMLIDILSGIILAIYKHDFSSKTLKIGLAHKLAYLVIMCAVACLQVALFDPSFTVDFDFPLFNVVCGFVIFIEFASISENAIELNPQLNELLGHFLQSNN